jgi:hypothetical protein
MLALAQLRMDGLLARGPARFDALLAVLIGTAGAIMLLRACVTLSKRALATRDAKLLAEVKAELLQNHGDPSQ